MFADKNGNKLTFVQAWPKIVNRLANIWLDLVLYKLMLVGHIPFHSIRNACYRFCGMKISKGSTLHMWARFYNPHNIEVGEDTVIGDNAFLDGRRKIKIGNHVDIASQVLI